MLALPEMPALGTKDRRPRVELYSKYSPSATIDPVLSDSSALSTSLSDNETERARAVEITPDDPVVIDFIWSNRKHSRRLKNILGCDEVEWDGSTLLVLKPSLREEDYKKKLSSFANRFFCCKELLISDARLWEKSLKFIEHEMAIRSCKGKLIDSEIELKMLFVGPKTEIVSLHQHCSDVLSGWRTQLEEETGEIQAVISLPSLGHLHLLQRSSSYRNVAEGLTIVQRQAGSKAFLYLKGPRSLVCKTEAQMLETLQTMASMHVTLDIRVIKFLSTVGLRELNALYDFANVAALAVDIEEPSVRLLVSREATGVAAELAEGTYTVLSVNSTKDEEVQRFIRSEEYKAFAASLCEDMVVMLDPEYEDIKVWPEAVFVPSLSVVGEESAATVAAERLESFLLETVTYTEQVRLDHPGFAKFLRTFKVDEVNRLKASFKAGIDIRQKEEVIVLRSTKPGLRQLRYEILKLLHDIKYDEQELKRPGLVRCLRSAAFRSERSRIERAYAAVVWIGGEDGDNDDKEVDRGSGREFGTDTTTSTKLVEYLVRNNSSKKRISLYKGDICRHNVDVIVNTANEELELVGGLARHILECAGPTLQQECRRYIREHKKISTGNAMFTSAGRLTFAKYVIHAVCPRWPLRSRLCLAIQGVEKEMENAVKSSLELADELKCKTIAFPAMSSGAFDCPVDIDAKQIVQTASTFLSERLSTTLTEVCIVLPEEDTYRIHCFKERMERDLDPIPKPTPSQSEVVRAPHSLEAGNPVELRSFSRSVTQPFRVTVKSGDISIEDVSCYVHVM